MSDECQRCKRLTAELEKAHQDESDVWQEISNLRQILAHRDRELEEAGQIIHKLRQVTGRIEKAKAYLPSARLLGAPVRSLNFVRSHLTREDIFHRVQAEAAGFAAKNAEEMESINSVFDFSPEVPWTPQLGLQQGVKPGARMPRPGTWSPEGLS